MLTLLALWTMPFWIFVIVVTICLFALVEYERPGWATIVFVTALALLEYCGGVPVWETVRTNPLNLIWMVVFYVILGAVWSVVKWYLFVTEIADNFKQAKAEFVAKKKVILKEDGSIPEELHLEFQDAMNYANTLRSKGVLKPKLKECKARIMIWIGYWPWSFVWTMINDPVKRLMKYIYRKLQAIYQQIVDKMFKPFEKEMAVMEKDLTEERRKKHNEELEKQRAATRAAMGDFRDFGGAK